MKEIEIAIIGGGIAGCVAAYELSKKGKKIALFESKNRLGGRLKSIQISNGSMQELGGQELTDSLDMEYLINLCKEIGCEVAYEEEDFLIHPYDKAGQPLETPASLKKMLQDTTIYDRVADRFNYHLGENSVWRKIIETATAAFEGINSDVISDEDHLQDMRNYLPRFITTTPGNKTVVAYFKQGSQQFFNKIRKSFDHNLHFNHNLIKITYEDERLKLNFSNGKEILAKHAILAIPLPMLRTVLPLSVGLPPHLMQKISYMVEGFNAKMIIPAIAPNPLIKRVVITPCFEAWWNPNLQAITLFWGGQQAKELNETINEKRCLFAKYWPILCKIFPSFLMQEIKAEDCVLKVWHHDINIRCSYSSANSRIFKKGTTRENWNGFDQLFFPILNGKILFAGEHACPSDYSTIGGAATSGYVAAQYLLVRK